MTPENRDLLARIQSSLLHRERDAEILEHAREVLSRFYRAPLSMSSVQPILDLAVELNPELKESLRMPEPRQPLDK